MPFTATCSCGASFDLKDEFAGRLLKCPSCQGTFTAQPADQIAPSPQADPAFDRDKFLLRQRVMTINQKYEIGDEQNRPILFVERPAHAMRQIAALLCSVASLAVILIGAGFLASTLKDNEPVMIATMIVGLLLGMAAAVVVGVALSAKRHVTFYRDASKSEKLLQVLQDAKFQLITSTYTVLDRDGNALCFLHKNIIYNLIRKRWYCLAPDKSLMYVTKEDSILLSLLRRFLGPFFGLLRTNFIILPANSEQVIGEFNRKFTLFDRYVLDLSADRTRALDRRIALAMGVMLDTGERR